MQGADARAADFVEDIGDGCCLCCGEAWRAGYFVLGLLVRPEIGQGRRFAETYRKVVEFQGLPRKMSKHVRSPY